MQKVRIFIKVKAHDREKEKLFESILYKDVEMPFPPTANLKICFDDADDLLPIEGVAWNVNGNYYVCKCADKIEPAEIGKQQRFKWYADFLKTEYKDKGWLEFEIEDEY